MKSLAVAQDIALTGATPQTGVATDETPFARGHNAVLVVNLAGATGTPSVLIQTSPDDTTYTTVATIDNISQQVLISTITLDEYIRLDVDVAGSAGTVSAFLLG